jgi:energy-coupling factor transport system permease protein
MRSPIAYSPDPGPLGRASALAASVYLGSIAVVAFACSNPLVLAGAGAAVVVAGLGAGAGRALAASARWAATLGILIVAVNGIASQRGETILVRGWDLPLLGQVDVSAEALGEGAVLALRIGVVLGAFAVHSARVDPDRLLRLVRPVARHSALTAALITRLVPLAAADHARLRDALALRGPGAAGGGRAALARRLLSGSLDRAVEIAASLELRGYARGAPRPDGRERASRYSWRFAAAGLAIAVLGIGARVAGVGDFDPYPATVVEADPATLALAASFPLLAALPFAGIRRHRG